MQTIEQSILKNLLKSEPFLRKALPYLKPDYFQEKPDRIIFETIFKYVSKYNSQPDLNALAISISERDDLFDTEYKEVESVLEALKPDPAEADADQQWLSDMSEKFCQERALHNAVLESIQIMDGKGKENKDKGAIPGILQEALAITFDPNIGHDFLDDADERYAFYHRKQKKFSLGLDYFDRITNGGLPPKTLTVILAGTNVGKSLMMCHFAAHYLSQHLNVLYITLEMSEEKIAQRVDANLMDITIDDLIKLPKEMFDKRIDRMKANYKGKLIVKEYPTACAGTNHFRALLNELAMKKQFKPDVVFIDYLNICTSSRVKMGNSINSYTLVKSIAEEVRGLAVEFNVPIMTATQTTRSGYTSSDPDLTDTSESFGLPATADLMFAVVTSEDLQKLNQLMVKQLKNRDADVNMHKRFVIGVNRGKMKLYDVSEDEQNLADSGDAQEDDTVLKSKYSKFKMKYSPAA